MFSAAYVDISAVVNTAAEPGLGTGDWSETGGLATSGLWRFLDALGDNL